VGASGAAWLLRVVWDGEPAELGATHPAEGIAAGAPLTYEIVLTAVPMFVIMAVATDTRAVGAAAAIAIGGTVAPDSLFGGGVTGASMNPADPGRGPPREPASRAMGRRLLPEDLVDGALRE
jgi:glycerol uptake facilitator-like aquaporin